MKKRLIAFCMAALLCAPAALAVSAYSIDDAFREITALNWTRSEEGVGDSVKITEKAMLDGHPYEFSIFSEGGRACQIFFSGWYEDMRMPDDLSFTDGWQAYCDCLYTSLKYIPDADSAGAMFNEYDIYWVLKDGLYDGTPTGTWRLLAEGNGVLSVMNDAGNMMEADHLEEGLFWLFVML